ncbi:Uncharacterized conserved protein YkwD, contains CAP (CSP/antigen 5/PR1) domain [Actinacidiphila yanglinensis]|uniref:Uncharacterized conserved protein YkwD, contains CAP (CSP/antigen 5/PR1) domain n=1 Tax=Actinacidiphila yanglinensis TaxID=310779 RepID=A0A1H6E4N3_9ACTN|nr:CAP domain-containing protein [Actinacidiphila yanglinensis]SEG92602.1 Uncharacterized conserved protein YkwD, contains CAP (CSP/antigen 5/PR1) domain [Actinacidiphila yanglinensis]
MGRHSRHAQPAAPQPGPRGHRGRRRHHPVRTGLLASSAALAVGAVAASSGLLSEVSSELGHLDGDGGATQAAGPGPSGGTPSSLTDTNSPSSDGTSTAAPGSSATTTPGGTPSTTRAASPSHPATTKAAAPTPTRTTAAPTTPVKTITQHTSAPTTSAAVTDAVSSARAQILTLVNQQRATAGCQPLTASSSLDTLAQNFSDEMAARGFFDHTDPDGKDPWDRAKALGITNLGGENIAMGQADAQAVMTAWMNSPGHRANILNCEYKTLGVGIHFGTGGPWWTQDFGY